MSTARATMAVVGRDKTGTMRFESSGAYPRLVRPLSDDVPNVDEWRALRLQNELILNAAGEGIYGLDLDGRATFVNPAAASMTGHTVEELIGQPMHDIVHHSHADGEPYARCHCPIYAAFRDGLVRNVCEEVFWRKDGSSFAVEYTSTPIFHGSRLVGAVVVFRDITVRRTTEERLRRALEEVQRLKEQLQYENQTLRCEIQRARSERALVGSSKGLRATLDLVNRAAPTDSTILLLGETGTGKELIARAIHAASPRRHGPLVRVNCGAIPPQLIESELFGHERGAFTGATQRRAGRFEEAGKGTLFLDEVGELPLDAQAKLLRALQEREFERVGSSQTLLFEARVVAATNRDLGALVTEGRFRADLYYRLNVVPIHVPPLRSRKQDIPELVEHFVRDLEMRWGRRLGRPSARDMEHLAAHDWPGNVRELQNLVERAAIVSDGAVSDFGFHAHFDASRLAISSWPGGGEGAGPEAKTLESLEAIEKEHILKALTQSRWRISGERGAGALLGMHPNTLRYRMKKLGIRR